MNEDAVRLARLVAIRTRERDELQARLDATKQAESLWHKVR